MYQNLFFFFSYTPKSICFCPNTLVFLIVKYGIHANANEQSISEYGKKEPFKNQAIQVIPRGSHSLQKSKRRISNPNLTQDHKHDGIRVGKPSLDSALKVEEEKPLLFYHILHI